MFSICQEILLGQFNRWELKELLKAVILSKPIARQGLVQVERTVVHPGSKTFTQKFYVRPDQVKDSDRVIWGHHNLPLGHSARPAEVRDLSSNKPVPDEIKQKTQDFYNLFPDAESFYKYIKHLGISWKDSDKPGIIMMRAKMALNNSQVNGMNIDDIKPRKKILPNAASSSAKMTNSNAPANSNPTPSATKQQNKATSQAPPTTAPAAAPQPAKKLIPEIIANPIKAAQDFIDSFDGPKEFCRAMLNMSIDFKRDYDHKTNFENAKSSLIRHMSMGVDVAALWKMDKKQLWNGIMAAPPNPPPPIQHSQGTPRTFSSVKDVNRYFLGVNRFDQRPDNNSVYGKWLNSAPDGTLPDFDDDSTKTFGEMEQKVLNIYTHHSRDFNGWLRGTFFPKTWGKGSFANIPQILQFFRRVKFMDRAIERFELPEPITNHRYTLCEPAFLNKLIHSSDGTFKDNAYMSTSCLSEVDDLLKDKFREEMRKDSTKVPVHMEIDIPAGRGWGAYIAPNSMPQYKNQCEFLLARGTKLEITKVERRPADSIFGKPHYYVKCKVIENNPKDVTKLDHQQFRIKSDTPSIIDAKLLKSALLDVAPNKDDTLYRFVENGFAVTPNSNKNDKNARRVIWN